MARVGLIFGGRSVEHEVSLLSARTVAVALEEGGHEVVALGITEEGRWLPPSVSLEALRGRASRLPPSIDPPLASLRHLLDSQVDLLFPIVHGSGGEDGSLQGLAEMTGLPYVGCDVPSSAVAMDKALCKISLERVGIPVVEWRAFTGQQFAADPRSCLDRASELPFPLFVKPALGGSSVGVVKVTVGDKLEEAVAFALRFGESVLVERGIVGRELECAVLGHRDFEASAVGEIVAGREFYDYNDKYVDDGARLLAPAELPAAVTADLRRLAIEAFEAIGGSGLARVDFFLEQDGPSGQGKLYVNEINTLPGFTAISMYPRLWEISGVPRPALVDRLLACARQRHGERRRLDAEIKAWLATL